MTRLCVVLPVLGAYGARTKNMEGDYKAEVQLHQMPGMPGMPDMGGGGMPDMGGGGMPDMGGGGMPDMGGGGMPDMGGGGMPDMPDMEQVRRNVQCGFVNFKDCCISENGCCTQWTEEQENVLSQEHRDNQAEYCSNVEGWDCSDPNAVYTNPVSDCTEEEYSANCLANVRAMNSAGGNLDEAQCHVTSTQPAAAGADSGAAAGTDSAAPAPAAGADSAEARADSAAPAPAAGADSASSAPATGGDSPAAGAAGADSAASAPAPAPASAAESQGSEGGGASASAPAPASATESQGSEGGAASIVPKFGALVAVLLGMRM